MWWGWFSGSLACCAENRVQWGRAGRGYHDDLWPPERLLLSGAHFSLWTATPLV